MNENNYSIRTEISTNRLLFENNELKQKIADNHSYQNTNTNFDYQEEINPNEAYFNSKYLTTNVTNVNDDESLLRINNEMNNNQKFNTNLYSFSKNDFLNNIQNDKVSCNNQIFNSNSQLPHNQKPIAYKKQIFNNILNKNKSFLL